ncbi:hypothetical protein JR316_0000195 [Psilocybe cubensis]|uniref:Uncharacterized protein n=1 Tax=Psilocybe cubensis TaxID=181762 RepID=A0ACB8HF78_PSICU|nr:hypothetical protein JR316_0000195 [Psilocybe cubensis]KAH9486131.1 hypothetical protein JR316_0000195 [Psilocybe cubensis]
MLHLENGACKSGINRAKVDRFVRENDRHNLITDPSRMICGPSGSHTETVIHIATELSWNEYRQAWECCLCYATFRSLKALNQHLASPRHQEKMYICREPSCNTRFTALSGFVWKARLPYSVVCTK